MPSIASKFFYVKEQPDRFAVMARTTPELEYEITSIGKEEPDAKSTADMKVLALTGAALAYSNARIEWVESAA